MRQPTVTRRYLVVAYLASAMIHGGTLLAVASWVATRNYERPLLGAQNGLIVLESAFSAPPSAPPQPVLEVKFAEEQVLILPDRAELAQRQFVETPAQRVPLSELLSREALDELAAASETPPAPAKVSRENGDALAIANAPASAKLQLSRTPAARQPAVTTSASASASRAAPKLQRGLRTGPSFANNAPPRYPEVARQKRWEGQVLLRLFISAEGSVTKVEVVRSSGHELLDAAAASAVRTWRGTPATLDGEPIATEEVLPVRFRMR